MRGLTSCAVVLLWGVAACSGRPLTTNGDGAPADAVAPVYDPCEPGTYVGGAFIQLVSPISQSAGYTAVDAIVYDGVVGWDQWVTAASEGTCQLLDHPTCVPECGGETFCVPGNRCAAWPSHKLVGTISIQGLAEPLELTPIVWAYSRAISDPFPAVAPDALVTLTTSGGDYAPFSLEARGVEPLAFEGANLSIGHGRPLDVTWTPPARPGAARIQARVFLQPSVGGPEIECSFPDTGAARIPASLIGPLVDRGVNGNPGVTLARRTVASTNIGPGCFQFEIAARVRRPVSVDGVTLCDGDGLCAAPLTCQPNFTCG